MVGISSCEGGRGRRVPAGSLSRRPALPALLLSLLLVACGGGGGGGSPASPVQQGGSPPPPPPAQGSVGGGGEISTPNPPPESPSSSSIHLLDWEDWAAKWNQSPHYQFLYSPGGNGGIRRYLVDPKATSGSTCCLERGDAPVSGTATFSNGAAVGLVKDADSAYNGC